MNQRNLREIVCQRQNAKKLFYSIEIVANNDVENEIFNFGRFVSVQPAFISLVWFGESYIREKSIRDVISLKVAHKLQKHFPVMPHLSCYGLTKKKLAEFLSMDFRNVLVVRGDQVSSNQEYVYASHLVHAIRKLKGNDSIAIAAAAYPEGHFVASTKDENMQALLSKISAGADILITQMCFTSTIIIEFIKYCRAHLINLPIIIGLFVPFNMTSLNTFLKVTKVTIPPAMLEEYQQKALEGLNSFHNYAIQQAVELILNIMKENLNVYGIHFYTMNHFEIIRKMLKHLNKIKLI